MHSVLTDLHELERRGRYRLMVWPVHCVLGTWGHNIHEGVAEQIARWELYWERGAIKVLKGMNALTEAYSAVKAEVPLESDEATLTNWISSRKHVLTAARSWWQAKHLATARRRRWSTCLRT